MYMHDKVTTCDQERKILRRCQAVPADRLLERAVHQEDLPNNSDIFHGSGQNNDSERYRHDHVLA